MPAQGNQSIPAYLFHIARHDDDFLRSLIKDILQNGTSRAPRSKDNDSFSRKMDAFMIKKSAKPQVIRIMGFLPSLGKNKGIGSPNFWAAWLMAGI